MTVYIVTSFRPDAILKHELSTKNKAVDCPDLTKLYAHRDPVPSFVPEDNVETLYSDTRTVPKFKRGYLKKGDFNFI